MNIQYLGQNCFVFHTNGGTLISDPAVSVNPLAKEINLSDARFDYILLTHAHEDHCADVTEILERDKATIISNFEIASHYGSQGAKYHPMNHGGRWNFEFGTVVMTNAIHTSTFPDGKNGGHPCGFIIMADQKTIYLAGDTALTLDMKIIPLLYPKLDVAILPIGDNFTMGIDQAIQASKFVECDNVIGCHYDTFPYIEIDHEEAKNKFSAQNINLQLLKIGEQISI